MPTTAKEAAAIANAANRWRVPSWVMMGVFGMETSFGSDIRTSSAGAMGAFQFIPSTAARYNYPMTNNPNDAQFAQQADAAAHYLSDLYKQYGNWNVALTHYSGGGYGEKQVKSKNNEAVYGLPTNGEKVVNGVKNAVGGAVDAATAIPHFLSMLGVVFQGSFWLRVLKFLGGAILILSGGFIMVRKATR